MRGVLVDVSTARWFEGVQLAPEKGTAKTPSPPSGVIAIDSSVMDKARMQALKDIATSQTVPGSAWPVSPATEIPCDRNLLVLTNRDNKLLYSSSYVNKENIKK